MDVNAQYIDRLSYLLKEVERLMDKSHEEHVSDAEYLRSAISLLQSGKLTEAQSLIRQLSPWAGEIAVECGQL